MWKHAVSKVLVFDIGTMVVLSAICLVLLPLNDAVVIGGDDGFELSKSLFLARRPDLAGRMWNDQPWLHTIITSQAFVLFGEHPGIARLYSIPLLYVCLRLLAARGVAPRSVLLVAVLLITSDQVGHLAFSAMVEVPTACLAWISGLLILSRQRVPSAHSVVFSGVVFAAACHVKLTAVLVLPGMVYLLIRTRSLRINLTWSAVFIVTFVLLIKISPTWSIEQLLGTHLRSNLLAPSIEGASASPWLLLLGSPALLVGGVCGSLFCHRNHRSLVLFSVLTLCACFLFATIHRPWWRFYIIHLNFPLAILSGIGCNHLLEMLLPRFKKRPSASEPAVSSSVTLCLTSMVALWWGFAVPTTSVQFSYVTGAVRSSEVQIIDIAKRYASEDSWCFTTLPEYAAAARILLPPELVVLSGKRFLGGLSSQELYRFATNYSPDILFAKKERMASLTGVWSAWISENYTLEGHTPVVELWIAKRLFPAGIDHIEPRLRILDL